MAKQSGNPLPVSNPAHQNPTLGTLLVIAAAVLFAIKGIFIKLAYQYGVTPTVLMTLRMLISLPFYIVIMARQRALFRTIQPGDHFASTIFA